MSHPVHTPEADLSTLRVGDTVWYTWSEGCAVLHGRLWDGHRVTGGVYESAGLALQAERFRAAARGERRDDLIAVAQTVSTISTDDTGTTFAYLRPDWTNVVRG